MSRCRIGAIKVNGCMCMVLIKDGVSHLGRNLVTFGHFSSLLKSGKVDNHWLNASPGYHICIYIYIPVLYLVCDGVSYTCISIYICYYAVDLGRARISLSLLYTGRYEYL